MIRTSMRARTSRMASASTMYGRRGASPVSASRAASGSIVQRRPTARARSKPCTSCSATSAAVMTSGSSGPNAVSTAPPSRCPAIAAAYSSTKLSSNWRSTGIRRSPRRSSSRALASAIARQCLTMKAGAARSAAPSRAPLGEGRGLAQQGDQVGGGLRNGPGQARHGDIGVGVAHRRQQLASRGGRPAQSVQAPLDRHRARLRLHRCSVSSWHLLLFFLCPACCQAT